MAETKTNIQVNGWFPKALFLAFLTLKLTGVIAWSWWWVTAPLWGPPAFFFAIAAVCGLGLLIIKALDK